LVKPWCCVRTVNTSVRAFVIPPFVRPVKAAAMAARPRPLAAALGRGLFKITASDHTASGFGLWTHLPFFFNYFYFFHFFTINNTHQNNHINTYKSYQTNCNILIYPIHILNSSSNLNYNIKQLSSLFIPTLSPFFTNINIHSNLHS